MTLYERLAGEVAHHIETGVFRPGERLPSVRRMCAARRVCPATVLQAYHLLEDRGLISTRASLTQAARTIAGSRCASIGVPLGTDPAAQHASGGTAMRIVIAIDGSELSRHAVDYVIKHRDTLGRGAELTCLFIDAPPVLRAVGAFGADPGMPAIPPIDPEQLVGPHMQALRDAGFAPTLQVREGDPGIEIAQAATEGSFDLIVMGTHGRKLLARALLGSVANKVLSSGTVPVVLVR